MDITGIGAAATAAQKVLSMIFPDKTAEEQSKLAATLALVQAQTDIDKAEAQSSDPLEHWRGAMGWTCAMAYFNNFILMPWAHAFGLNVPTIDMTQLGELTAGMLGLGAMHVYQKVNQ
jgi:hypothetical protein